MIVRLICFLLALVPWFALEACADEFYQNADGLIVVRSSAGVYVGSIADVEKDAGVRVPVLPTGAHERTYERGKRHDIARRETKSSPDRVDLTVDRRGELQWAIGDSVIGRVGQMLTAANRRGDVGLRDDVKFLRNALEMKTRRLP